jgi:hypothetical protein
MHLFYSRRDPSHVQGFRTIQVGEGVHPYVREWWLAGHIIGFGDKFVHEIWDFLTAIVEGRQADPSFYGGVQCQKVLAVVDKSIAERRW